LSPLDAQSFLRSFSLTAAVCAAAPCVFLIFYVFGQSWSLLIAQEMLRSWLERFFAGAALTLGIAYLLPCARQIHDNMAIRCFILVAISTLFVWTTCK
jgi:hypothetical protein